MQSGMIGLGPMGGNMVFRLAKAGPECLVYDNHHEAVDALVAKGAKGTTSIPDFLKPLSKPRPRLVWLMVPAPVISAALFARFSSRGKADYGARLLSARRFEFGGHVEKPRNDN
jgi:6-phosphogluconate dehydrogenase (decarboxylating)